MNTRISDAAVSAACMVVYSNYIGAKRDYRQQCDEEMRDALEAALPHLQPAKPEAVRLRDELRERAAFEAWAQSIGTPIEADDYGNYLDGGLNYAKLGWQAALASVQPSPAWQAVDLEQFRVAVYCMQKYTGLLPRKYWDKGSKAFDAEAIRLMTVIDGAEVTRG